MTTLNPTEPHAAGAEPAATPSFPLHGLLCAFRDAVCVGGEGGHVFQNVRDELRQFCAQPWSEEAELRLQQYLAVPDHCSACQELNFRSFSTTPLVVGERRLHLHHVLEAFSHTTPARYAGVWLPLLDCFEACRWTLVGEPAPPAPDLRAARFHLRQQQQEPQPQPMAEGADAPRGGAGAGGDLDAMMQNILSSFPGLQGMVQQMLSGGGEGPEQGIQQLLGQVQGLLQPLLAQATQDGAPGGADLQPAVGKILEGFAGLTQALGAGAGATPPVEAPMMEQ